MSLAQYKKRRSFSDTPEPTGGKGNRKKLHFVVQKHAASQLHYDFRLEMAGVLKSWAVPKGPSMDPNIKRLAILVEDHPYDYRTFEGTIPTGNYGAGTVMVWDEGSYKPISDKADKKSLEKELDHQFSAGKIKFILKGKKLKGSFTLLKTKGHDDNTWLLIKLEDEYATQEDILNEETSVRSGKTIEELKVNPVRKS